MKKFIFLLAFVFSLVLTGCEKAGTQVQTDGAKHDFDVQFLFETDGVKVYRFYDSGDYIYFTNCNGETSHNENTGKFRDRKLSINNRIENNDND